MGTYRERGDLVKKSYKSSEEYKKIRASLLRQLEENRAKKEFFLDLIDDYMDLWIIKNQLIDDVDERGVVTEYKNGANQYGYKRNDSVGDLLKVNTQMLKILQQLEIKVVKPDIEEVDEDEL